METLSGAAVPQSLRDYLDTRDENIVVRDGGGREATLSTIREGIDDDVLVIALWCQVSPHQGHVFLALQNDPAINRDSEGGTYYTFFARDSLMLDAADEHVFRMPNADGDDVGVGEIYANTVTLCWRPGLLDEGVTSEMVNWPAFLDAQLDACGSDDVMAAFQEAQSIRTRSALIELITRRRDGEIDSIRRDIDSTQQQVREYESQTATYFSQLRQLQQRLDIAIRIRDTRAGVADEDVESELMGIEGHADVESVAFDRHRVMVTTHDIGMFHPVTEETVTVGKFRISLNMEDRAVQEIRNLTNRRGNYDHPHVSDGSLCAGSYTGTLDQLLDELQVSATINLIIDILKHVNPEDDWGRRAEWWFVEELNPDREEAAA